MPLFGDNSDPTWRADYVTQPGRFCRRCGIRLLNEVGDTCFICCTAKGNKQQRKVESRNEGATKGIKWRHDYVPNDLRPTAMGTESQSIPGGT